MSNPENFTLKITDSTGADITSIGTSTIGTGTFTTPTTYGWPPAPVSSIYYPPVSVVEKKMYIYDVYIPRDFDIELQKLLGKQCKELERQLSDHSKDIKHMFWPTEEKEVRIVLRSVHVEQEEDKKSEEMHKKIERELGLR